MKTVFKVLIAACLFGVFKVSAQCPTPFNVNNTGCSGSTKTISAQSYGYQNVDSHRWYTSASGGSPISGIQQNTAPGSGYYISSLTKTFTSSESYYVSAVCNGVESSTRVKVDFTMTTSSNLIIGVQGGAQEFYCPGETVTLTASGGSNYTWKNGSGITIGSGSTVNVTSTGTYRLTGNTGCNNTATKYITITFKGTTTPTIASKTPGCGNATITRNSPTDSDEAWFWQTSANGTATGTANANSSWVISSGSLYLRPRVTGVNVVCWGTAIPVSYTIGTAPSIATGSNVERCGPGSVTVTASPGSGGDIIRWYTSASGGSVIGTGTSLTRTISSTTDYYAESYNSGISCPATSRKKITATINPVPQPTIGSIPSDVCYGETGVISIRSFGYDNISSHKWYTTPTGGTEITSGVQKNTAPSSGDYISTLTKSFTGNETFYVAAVCDGTESSRLPVNFTLNTTPALQIEVLGGAQLFYCVGETVTLQTSDGSSGQWRNGSGNLIGNGTSVTVTASDTYSLTGTSTCGTGTDQITITFKNFETPTVLSKVAECGQSRIIKGNPSDTNYEEWYWQTLPDGEEMGSWNIEDTLTISSGPLYLRSRLSGPGGFECWGPPVTVSFDTLEQPEPPTNPYQNYCTEGSVTLHAYFSPGVLVRWYDSPTGGTLIGEGSQSLFVNNIVEDVTYYAESFDQNSHCVSATRTPYEIIFGSGQPGNVFGSNVKFCEASVVTLEVDLPINADEVKWYNNSDDETPIATGLTYTTPVISETTTYYLESVNTSTGCVSSNRLSIQAILTDPRVWYLDQDGDGYGDINNPSSPSCEAPANYVANSDDTCPDYYDPSNDCDLNVSNLIGDNYVYSRSYQKSAQEMLVEDGVDQQTFDFFTSSEGVIQDITYFDGLGRNIQSIGLEQSPLLNGVKKDIVNHVEYDDYGRMEKEWMPFAADNGNFGELKETPKQSTLDYYNVSKYENTLNPYSQKELEASPLSRITKQAAPGSDWAMGQGHEIEFNYQSNTSADGVRQFDVALTESILFGIVTYEVELVEEIVNITYPDGELYKNVVYDENHNGSNSKLHTTEEFKDKQGRVVLKRTYALEGTAEEPHDTYYVYDDFGNLTYVLPPLMEAATSTLTDINNNLDELGYQYVYDHRNRLVEKKIPGKGWEYIVYNKLDQPIMTQDSIQRTSGEWLFTKYDAFGRVAFTGKSIEMNGSSPSTRDYVQSQANAVSTNQWVSRDTGFSMDNITIEYDNLGYPNTSMSEVLTINYYDDYGFDPSDEPMPPSTVFDASLTGNVRGLATGSKIKVLDPNVTAGQETWITTITRYDGKGRPIYTYGENDYLGTTDIVESKLDFVGKPLIVRSAHTRNGITIVTIDNFEYDHAGRLLKQTQCIGDGMLGYNCEAVEAEINLTLNDPVVTTGKIATESITVIPSSEGSTTLSGNLTLRIDSNATSGGGTNLDEELIVYNKYDELGQLVQKKVGGDPNTSYDMTDGLQTIDYAYNVRGWLKSINKDIDNTDNDLFNFGIAYNAPQHGGTPLYNGNISETEWNTQNTDNATKWYTYRYDALNRLEQSFFGDNSGDPNVAGRYSTDYDYDKNGNITDLSRTGDDKYYTIDVLSYTYYNGGNRLKSVSDMGTDTNVNQEGFSDGNTLDTDYEYDGNGNLTMDLNKGIQANGIEYNHLNLPTKIMTSSGDISYVYDAVGTKLEKKAAGSVTLYAGNYIYAGASGTETFQFMSQPEGYVTPSGINGYDYVYQYKDHLGNIRLSYLDDGNGGLEIVEENNYYPFGLKHKGYNDNTSSLGNDLAQKWKYLDKEFEESFDLNMYEMDWRQYDPAIGRFTGIDKLTESFQSYTPYHYSYNSPIVYKDPSGLFSTVVNDDGEVIDHKDDGDPFIYLNSRNGEVVGIEEEGREYKKGDKIFEVDKSNPNYSVFSLIAASGEALIKSSTVYKIPQSIPVYDDAGKLIGRWITKLKVPFKALKIVGGVLKPVSAGFTFISTVNDVIDYDEGKISGARLGYRTTGTVATIITSSAVGGPLGIAAGVVVGGTFYAGEIIYDGVEASAADRSDPDNNANTIHSIGEFFRNLGWAIDNLERGLGEGIND